MSSICLALALSALVSSIDALTIDFNSAIQCSGSIVGQFQGTTSQGCQTSFSDIKDTNNLLPVPGNSNKVVINSTANDNGTAVAFYGEPNCRTLIALGNVPVCLGLGSYLSFEVIDITDSNLGFMNLEPAPVQSLSANATATAKPGEELTDSAGKLLVENVSLLSAMSATTGTASSSTAASSTASATTTKTSSATTTDSPTAKPRHKREAQHAPIPRDSKPEYIEQMRNGKRMEHGAVRRSAGQIYVYQQVAKRTWRGVPVREWNEQRHKRSTADLASPKTGLSRRGQGVSRRDLGPLRDRAISATSCNLVRTCLVDSGDDPGFSINNVGAELLNAIEALNFPQDDWLFLEAPVVVEAVDTSGKSEGFIYAQTQVHNNGVQMCSDQGTERDALQAALAMDVDGSCASDMRVDLKFLNSGTDGVTNTLYVSTRSVSNSDKSVHPICEAVQVDY